MKVKPLETTSPQVYLIEPAIERDALLGVRWLEGEAGHDTLRLMGVPEKDSKPTTLEDEGKRVEDFITNEDHLNWMIQYEGRVVGAIWVDLVPNEHMLAPSIHLMIGDPAVRGKGVGSASAQAVIEYLQAGGSTKIYSRHLIDNVAVARLQEKLGFKKDGESYSDKDGLTWQNVTFDG